jgi:hypothetical protein
LILRKICLSLRNVMKMINKKVSKISKMIKISRMRRKFNLMIKVKKKIMSQINKKLSNQMKLSSRMLQNPHLTLKIKLRKKIILFKSLKKISQFSQWFNKKIKNSILKFSYSRENQYQRNLNLKRRNFQFRKRNLKKLKQVN